jgi:hypothetical protein
MYKPILVLMNRLGLGERWSTHDLPFPSCGMSCGMPPPPLPPHLSLCPCIHVCEGYTHGSSLLVLVRRYDVFTTSIYEDRIRR